MPNARWFAIMLFAGIADTAVAQPKEKAALTEEARKEFQKFQGTWTIESQEIDGRPSPVEEIRTRTFFCGADVFIIRKGTELLQVGVHKIDPSKSPKTINATISKGLYQGETMLGIYELDRDRLKICFDIEGQKRPTEFKTAPREGRFLVVYRRSPSPPEETDDITGDYNSLSVDLEGKKLEGQAEIIRHGNAYIVKYLVRGEIAYIGIGLRRGDTLSVCWANRGEVGISVYRIQKSGLLDGEYTRLGGIGAVDRESLTPRKK